MEKDSTAAKVLPKGFLLPLIEAAGNVEDDSLEDLWAQLLASGAKDATAQHPAFIDALRRMNVEDARVLKELAQSYAPARMFALGQTPKDARGAIERLMALNLLERKAYPKYDRHSVQGPAIVLRDAAYTISPFGLQFIRTVDPANAPPQ